MAIANIKKSINALLNKCNYVKLPVTTNGRVHGTSAPFVTSSQVPLKKLLFALNLDPSQVNRKQYGSSIICSEMVKNCNKTGPYFIYINLRAAIVTITIEITNNFIVGARFILPLF